jgi:hypothetical protein
LIRGTKSGKTTIPKFLKNLVLNNEIDWRIKLKIIESLQKKQGKNQEKKKN